MSTFPGHLNYKYCITSLYIWVYPGNVKSFTGHEDLGNAKIIKTNYV